MLSPQDSPPDTSQSKPPVARPRLGTVLARALRLRCPVCGEGRMFRGLLSMNPRCAHCGLWFERGPGYFLGSIYVNYAATAMIATTMYLVPMLAGHRSPTWLLVVATAFCVIFPLAFFSRARSVWLGINHWLSPIDPAEPPSGGS